MSQIVVSATTDNKDRINSLAALIAALAKAPYSVAFDQDCPKTLIEQSVSWLVQNPTKWPTNQINFCIVDEPSLAPATQTYNKSDARKWKLRLDAVKPIGWVTRETYAGAHGILAINSLLKS
jgi:hypothetical protein